MCCLLMVPVNFCGHELEVGIYWVPTKLAPASYAHAARQVCLLFLLLLMREVKIMAAPFFATQQGTIIRPLGAIFCQGEHGPYGQDSLCCPLDRSFIPTSMGLAPN